MRFLIKLVLVYLAFLAAGGYLWRLGTGRSPPVGRLAVAALALTAMVLVLDPLIGW